MIHPIALSSDPAAGGGGGGGSSISFSPPGGDYSGSSISVTISATGATVAYVRWKIDAGGYTTVAGTSTTATVPITTFGHTLYADALDSGYNVIVSTNDDYLRSGGG